MSDRPHAGPSGVDVVLDPLGRPADRIVLNGLRAKGFHGVFDHERRDGQDFVVDVVLHVDSRTAAGTDDLRHTVHYGELAISLAAVVRGEPVNLIETLADRLAAVCLSDERVLTADVAVHKPGAPIPEDFADVVVAVRRCRSDLRAGRLEDGDPRHALDRVPAAARRAVVALGANLGDRAATLQAALDALAATEGVRVVAVSPAVETDPVGGPEQPDYLNAVALLDTRLSPHGLLAACQGIEARYGRTRDVRWGARTLDLDVIDYAGLVAADDVLEVPHPRAAGRAFVLAPWLAADPGAVLPTPGGTRAVRDLLAAASDREGVRPSAVVLHVPSQPPSQPPSGGRQDHAGETTGRGGTR